MKKSLFTLLVALVAATSTAFGQAAKAPDPETETQLIKLEKDSWDAWKRQDAAWFEANLAADFPSPSGKTRAQVIQAATTGCKVTSYSFENFRVNMMSADAALLTY